MYGKSAITIDPSWTPLKVLRKTRHLTQKAVAYGVPCAPATITDIELYNYRPGPELQARIAAYFGVTPEMIWPPQDSPDVHQSVMP